MDEKAPEKLNRRRTLQSKRVDIPPVKDRHGRSPKVSHLPPELVREIIKLATNTFPSPFSVHRFNLDPSASPFSFVSSADQALERGLHSQSLLIKGALSLVCKEWNVLTTEFLFNSVRITRKDQIKQLWEAFESRRSRLREARDGPGCAAWSVRVLWVDDEVPRTERISPDLCPEGPSLLDFVVRCRHIIVFRGFGARVHSPLLKTANLLPVLSGIVRSTQNPLWALDEEEQKEFAEHKSEALMPSEHVELEFYIEDLHEMTMFLKPPNTDSLDAIKVLKLHSTDTFAPLRSVKTRLRLPNLVELHLAKLGAIQAAVTFIMPSLTKVVCELIPKEKQVDLVTFLVIHGEGLKELSLRMPVQDLSMIRLTCPQLRRLDIAFDNSVFAHKSIQALGIYNLPDILRTNPERLLELIAGFPSLRVVQDSDWKSSTIRDHNFTYWERKESHEWRKIWRDFVEGLPKGIELVGWRGRPVVIQPDLEPSSP
ncbi:hypothetical protein FRB90_009678 [Tulasnella sp. 427]|nr:hypothetical protein FRB90_009678 [Tulasnella sp. 427]